MGPDAIRATMLGQMRDAMKDDVEKLLQVCCVELLSVVRHKLPAHSDTAVDAGMALARSSLTRQLPVLEQLHASTTCESAVRSAIGSSNTLGL